MTQELTAGSILSLFQTSKQQRQTFVDAILTQVDSGNINPLDVHLQVKCMEDIIKQVSGNDKYKSAILDAAEKSGKKFNYQNAEFAVKESGTKYDYSQCGDTELLELEAKAAELDAKIKAKQKFLQTVPTNGIEVVIGDVLTTVYPPAKKSTTTVFVTLK